MPATSSCGIDERGMGQSGGRAESATFEEFATDARAVFTYLGKRKDVDPKRISVIGYGEGGWVALIVAAREQRLAAARARCGPCYLRDRARPRTTTPAVRSQRNDRRRAASCGRTAKNHS